MNTDDKQPDKPVPTEDEVKAHNEAEEARWQGDYKDDDLVIPYKRETAAESDKGDEKKEDKTAEKAVETEDEPAPAEEYEEPAPVITVQDPGEYKPADFSFEVTLKDGKTVKVSTVEEADKLADDPDNFETPKQLMDFINKQNKMRILLDKDYEKWEAQKQTFTQQLETETNRREQVDTYVKEFNYLESKGLLPKVAKQYRDADWSDPEIAKQEGIKEQIALTNFFLKENTERIKAGIKPLTSMVDAYSAWQLDEGHVKEQARAREQAEAQKKADDARKVASSRVAGVSPTSQGTYVPKGIAVGNPHVFDRGAAQWDD